jgi:hypothetical protein
VLGLRDGRHGAHAVDGARERELRSSETLDEVATPAPASLLEPGKDAVDRRETARHALSGDRTAYDDAMPVEQSLRDRVRSSRRIGFAFG